MSMVKFSPKVVELSNPHYSPEILLDTVMRFLGLKYDRHLARRLGVQPPQICKIRKRRLLVTPAILISMHEETGLGLRELRALMGDYREHTRPSAKHPSIPQTVRINDLPYSELVSQKILKPSLDGRVRTV